MNKQDAIIDLQNLKLSYANNTWNQHHFETFDIAIECIQHCIDEENTSCSKYISPELVQDLSDFIDENYSDI